MRVEYGALESALERMLFTLGFSPDRALHCARLFAETTRDGVYTHGLARFPRFVAMVRNGSVDPSAVAVRTGGFGAMERWNGHLGPGNLSASAAMARAVDLAKAHGIGAVFLANTNHWMRGGSYGWQAADAGCFGLCFTNTLGNLPPWGSADPALGNNPLVIAVPRSSGEHVVLDMAMSQYSFGTLSSYSARRTALPFPGGFDPAGELTTDAAAIAASGRALPVGLWKGSGLAMVLDLMAAMLSGGLATHQVPTDPERESGISQVFFAIDPRSLGSAQELDAIADGVVASVRDAAPLVAGKPVRYPGEQTLAVRRANLELGVPVDESLWKQLLAQAY